MDNKINIDLLKKLVSIQSLSKDHGQCIRALEIIKTEIESHQIPCLIKFNNNVPFLIAGNFKSATVLFLNHIDVVPCKTGQFRLRGKGEKLLGRGVLDMKGPLVMVLSSFLRLWQAGQRQFLFVITSDEEIGGFDGTCLLTKTLFKNIKAAIIPDSTSDDLVVIQKAPFHIKLESIGKSCHGSRPWEGTNAAEKLLKCCNEIINKIHKNSPEHTSACLSQFHSGDASNKVPDGAMATLDIRIREEKEVFEIIKTINACTGKWICNWQKIDEPLFFEASKNDPFIERWINSFEKITKRKSSLKIECGASDARFLWSDLGIPVVVTSAKGGGIHSDNEWVSLSSLQTLGRIVFEFGCGLKSY